MRRSQIRPTDTVEVDLPYCISNFPAKVEGFTPDGRVRINPIPKGPTWRTVDFKSIAKRLDPPPRKRRKERHGV